MKIILIDCLLNNSTYYVHNIYYIEAYHNLNLKVYYKNTYQLYNQI